MPTTVVNVRSKPYDVYIGRPGPFGNPFSHLLLTGAKYLVSSRDEAIWQYRIWIQTQPELIERARKELKGKVLGCWCKPLPCHGDILAEIVDWSLV